MIMNKVLIILGEPNSVFSELLFKYFKSKKYKSFKKDIILIGCYNLIYRQMKKLNYNFKFNIIKNPNDFKKKFLNIIDVKYNFDNEFSKISTKSNNYLEDCFKISLKIIKNKKKIVLFNGPISKKHFLQKKFFGLTEYIANKTHSKNQVMLIYNKKIAVSPLTTHIPLKDVSSNINQKKIINNVIKINNFYKNTLKKKPNIAVLGLNPHCETVRKISEEVKIIVPSIKKLKKKKININGPFSADTFFINKNLKNYDVVVGMYHDQVLTPMKTLFNFNAINITIGLPFIRVSPDHGPNIEMVGKNKSDPSSVFCAMDFFNYL